MKDDQREAKAEIAVLVTTAFPKEVNNFSYINGILALPGKPNLRLKDVSTATTSWGCLLILKSETSSSRGGISPPGPHGTGREPLDSSGSYRSAKDGCAVTRRLLLCNAELTPK